MSETFALNLGLNSTSLGQVSWGIAKEIYRRELNPCIFNIGNPDSSTQIQDEGFFNWLRENSIRANKDHNRKNPVIKNWHIGGSLESVSDYQILFTYHELSDITPTEANILKNQHKVLTCSEYSVEVFAKSGVAAEYCPLFFDREVFKPTQINRAPNRIEFLLPGKCEKRKSTYEVIHYWVKKYGNNPGYVLNCAIFNPFIENNAQAKQMHNQMIAQALGGRVWNVNFLPWSATNQMYNTVLNSSDIVIGASRGESYGWPEMQAIALGKHAVMLNAHGYKGFINSDNSCLFEPSGMELAQDNLFFAGRGEYNVGNWFTWSPEDFYRACDEAVGRVQKDKFNTEGLKLQEKFTIEKMVDQILNYL